jgi:hypothetical protein
MKKVLTRDTLLEILDSAGLDPEDVVYNWPSGMYGGYGGHVSFALTATGEQLAQFFKAIGNLICYATFVDKSRRYPEGFANLESLLPSGTDPLGKGTVTYFRGWELEPEDGDDTDE